LEEGGSSKNFITDVELHMFRTHDPLGKKKGHGERSSIERRRRALATGRERSRDTISVCIINNLRRQMSRKVGVKYHRSKRGPEAHMSWATDEKKRRKRIMEISLTLIERCLSER